MNLNWFFDNLTEANRQRVWARAVPRYGEIWWHFPYGDSTECSHAIIYNVRENLWYDTRISRTSGTSPRVFPRPVVGGGRITTTIRLSFTPTLSIFTTNITVVGVTSGATGIVLKTLGNVLNLVGVSGTFINGEGIRNTLDTIRGTLTSAPIAQQLDVIWQHEIGRDQIVRDDVSAIEAYFETASFQFSTGGPVQDSPVGVEQQTRITQLEPDFGADTGGLQFYVKGRAATQAPVITAGPFTMDQTTELVGMREQRQEMTLKLVSNTIGGDFQLGRALVRIEPGDVRR
jgi:hypothetical protein